MYARIPLVVNGGSEELELVYLKMISRLQYMDSTYTYSWVRDAFSFLYSSMAIKSKDTGLYLLTHRHLHHFVFRDVELKARQLFWIYLCVCG